jgi:epoxyqueuosine reductase
MLNEHLQWAIEQHRNQIPVFNERLKKRLINAIEKGLPRDA